MANQRNVAVIGAGMAGASAARVLLAQGWRVEVFDKSRGTGGRAASASLGGARVDLGAQSLPISPCGMQVQLSDWQRQGLCRPCEGLGLVVPAGMSRLTRQLLEGATLHVSHKVTALVRDGGKIALALEDGNHASSFDAVVLAVPAPQAVPLLAGEPRWQGLAERAGQQDFLPQWVLAVEERGGETVVSPVVRGRGPISIAVCQQAKGLQAASEASQSWVVQAGTGWSLERVDAAREEVQTELLATWRALHGERELLNHRLHRWLYALPVMMENTSPARVAAGVALAGDWLVRPDMSGAFESGSAAACALIAQTV